MTTKAQLVAFLAQFPDDAEIDVAVAVSCGYDNYTTFETLDLQEHVDVLDFRAEMYKDSKRYGQCFIRLGSDR